MKDEDKKHILSKLIEENLNLEPFPYFIFNNFFSKKYYEELLLSLIYI